MRVFVDANIVVDLLCERYPWFPSVMRIFNMSDRGQIELYCSTLSLGTASYLMETRKMSPQDIFDGIDLLCQMCTPTMVDASVVRQRLTLTSPTSRMPCSTSLPRPLMPNAS